MASNNFDLPDNVPVIDQNGNTALPWAQWFARVQRIVSSVQSSGVTADRPTKGLWVGRTYFDTTLGKPIWVLSVNPAVWVNGAGGVV
jgi:hypothetical protein